MCLYFCLKFLSFFRSIAVVIGTLNVSTLMFKVVCQRIFVSRILQNGVKLLTISWFCIDAFGLEVCRILLFAVARDWMTHAQVEKLVLDNFRGTEGFRGSANIKKAPTLSQLRAWSQTRKMDSNYVLY